jgi:lysophospholipase L1-like esterase
MIQYAAIGDSLTSGVGDLFGGGFVPKYARLIQDRTGQSVVYDKIGISGARTANILSAVSRDHRVRSALEEADIITLTAGGNDMVDAAKAYKHEHNSEVFRQAVMTSRSNLASIFTIIRQLKNGHKPYMLRTVDLYNPSPELPEGNFWVKRFNSNLESFENGNLKVANIFNAFQGNERLLLAIDRFHPNGRGYSVIAEELDRQGYNFLG